MSSRHNKIQTDMRCNQTSASKLHSHLGLIISSILNTFTTYAACLKVTLIIKK